MQVTVKFVNPPKEGKKLATIKADNDNYYYYDPSKFSFSKGGRYDIEIKEQEFQGKVYAHVQAVKGSAAPANGSAPVGDRWWMPFVSNTVAHAIAANQIAEPAMIKAWAAAAKQAAMELDGVKVADDDEPDF